MIGSILKALFLTGITIITVALVVAVVYVSIWVVIGVSVMVLFYSIFTLLQAKKNM